MALIKPTFTQVATGLRFPEGPVAMPDGSVILVEIERRTLSRVTPTLLPDLPGQTEAAP